MSDFIKQQAKLVAAALPLLKRSLILSAFIDKQSGADFKGAQGDVLNIRRPAVLAARSEAITRSKTRSILTDEIVESTIQVKLDQHVYSAVDITDAEATLDIESFAGQILAPQVEAIASDLDLKVRDALETLPALTDANGATVVIGRVADPEAQAKAIRFAIPKLRQRLNKNHVPAGGRVLLVGSEIEAALINDPHLTKLDESGTTDALREASIGRLYGFTIVSSDVIEPDEMIAVHPTAFKLAMIAPVAPAGAAFASSQSANGVAMRYIRDYNSDKAMDRSFLSVYTGISPVLDPLVNDRGQYVDAAGAVIANPDASKVVKAQLRGVKVSLEPVVEG
ncbi:major capsid protein [Streptomyces phage Sycamore]|uniref:Major capsid protein n=1 Tax=Streptomyces phage Sycamore TaxID=2767589 RepID=A0A873WNA3_9CAUD|nr:major capsid protein [Streptomyces phage Sycamore]